MNQERLNTLAQRFANLLHDMDPVGTTCLLNLDMEDEYDYLGVRVAERFCNDQPLRDALMAVFDQAFWPGCLTESHRRWSLQRLVDELQREAPDPLQHPSLAYNHSQIYEWLVFGEPHRQLWTWQHFMQHAPERLAPDLLDSEPEYEEVEPDTYRRRPLPAAGAPDNPEGLAWMHAHVFEKARRRTNPARRTDYREFREAVLQDDSVFDVYPRPRQDDGEQQQRIHVIHVE